MATMAATMPSIRSVDFVLGGLQIAGGVLGDRDVGGHPAGDGVATVHERVIEADVAWSALVSSVGFRTRGPDAREDSEFCAIGDAQLAKDSLDEHLDGALPNVERASDDFVRLTLTQ